MDHFNVEALVLKGKLLWSLDKTEEGNEQFWVAHSLEPNHSEVIEFLSIIRPKAEEAYERARKEYMEGNDTGALMWIRKGLDVFHDMSKLLLLRASIMRKRKSFENAIDDLELASKFMEAEHIDKEVKIQIGLTYNDMGKLLFSKGKHDGAISVFNESIKYLPQDPGIHINRGGRNVCVEFL
jgi:tetratricopeptide (TPR) repeat protein